MKLSIITINYNNLGGLKKTFKSVFEQTCQDFEYIIIDGGSKDGSKELIEENKNKFTYWVSEPDKGIYNAMNKGWRQAKSEYCIFLNSGDALNNKSAIQYLTNEIKNKPLAYIYYTDLLFFDEKSNKKQIQHYSDKISLTFFAHSSLGHPSSVISKQLLNDLNGYNENYNIISDWLFFIKAFLGGYSFHHIDMTLSVFTLGGVSSLASKLQEEMEKVYNEDLFFIAKDMKHLNSYRNLRNSRVFKLFLKLTQIFLLKKYE